MKKVLESILCLFVLLVLSTPVFAQDLDSSIYDKNGFRLDQNIPEINRASTTTSRNRQTSTSSKPVENLDSFKEGEPASCFDYYTFGSIAVNLSTDMNVYFPGDPMMIRGQVINNNTYPITNLTVRARLVKDTPNPEYLRSEIITLDDAIVAENITLSASSSFNVNYSHVLPFNAPKGEYKILFYAYNNDRFNQAGLSFTNDIVASRLGFTVKGNNPQQIYLDQTKITLNDQIHNVMAFMTNHVKDTAINISIPLVNPSDTDENMTVTYTLYKWDGLREENKVNTKTENITVPAKGEVKLNYSVNKTDASVYFLNVVANNQILKKDKSVYDIKTESNIRFSVSGYDFPRVNSFGVNAYPIKANQEATLFTCYHNGANQNTITPVNISTILYDEKDKVIAQTEYIGKIGGDIRAIVKKFTLKKDLANFKVVTTLTDSSGKVLDTIENNYKCTDIDPTTCPTKTSSPWLYVLYGVLTLIIVVFIIKKIKEKVVYDNNI